jgi:hypothetical protein
MKNRRALYLTLCAALCLMLATLSVQAQTTSPAQAETKEDETNLETQLYLILGTNQDVADSKLPTSLDPVVKELRAALPFKNYRLAATLINRVKNDSRLSLSWVGGTLASATPNTSSSTPSFSQFNVRQVKVIRNNAGQPIVQMLGFNFGARIPIQVSSAVASTGAVAAYNYENTGLSTDISMRESEPVIVGTMNIGPSGDAIILVVAAKRTQK